jgi:hypothetical protein
MVGTALCAFAHPTALIRTDRAMIKLVAATLAAAALICGLVAARFSYKSTRVQVDPGWGDFEPVVPELKQMGWTGGTLKAMDNAATLNRKAVAWTVAAVILGTFSSLSGLFV